MVKQIFMRSVLFNPELHSHCACNVIKNKLRGAYILAKIIAITTIAMAVTIY